MSKRDWCFRAAFLACCFLAGYLLWANQYLPMVDLPQHAAQLSIWQRWDHPEFNYRLIYEHNWSASQQIPYLLIYSLTWAFSIHAALRLALSVFLLGIPVATLFLLRETKLPAWLVFLTFPTAFSFSFYWGFINYLAVTPLLILLLAWTHRYSLEHTPARGLKLLVLNHFLFFTHPLGLLFGGLLSVPLIAVRSGHPMVATRRLLPWVLSAPIPLLWLTLTLSQETVEPVQMAVTWWNLGAGRFFEFFALIVGLGNPAGLLWGLILLTVPFILGFRLAADWTRRVPLVTTAVLFLLFPMEFLSINFLYPRLAVLTLVALLYALDPVPRRPPNPVYVVLPALLAVLWLTQLNIKFAQFNEEASDFNNILDQASSNSKVVSLIFENASGHVPAPVYLNFGSWYQVEKGGTADPSFAGVYTGRFRYRPETQPDLPPRFSNHPEHFDWSSQARQFDEFIVRSSRKDPLDLFEDSRNWVELVDRSGSWSLFRRVEP